MMSNTRGIVGMIVVFTYYYILGLLGSLFSIYLLLFSTNGKYISVAYFLWIYLDRHTRHRGGRSWHKLRTWFMHGYILKYLPLTLHKTADLPEENNYILAAFPHGAVGVSHQIITLCFITPFENLFPKINLQLGTLDFFFFIPFIRDLLLLGGGISASEKSLKYFFEQPKKGNAIWILPGGTREQLLTKPGFHTIILKERLGFCRIALQTGSHLVPVYSFGENEMYRLWKPSKGSWLNKLQELMKPYSRVVIGCCYGDSGFGICPNQHPLNVVFGAPIPVKKSEKPTGEEIRNLHSLFIEKLVELFETEKHKFIENAETVHLDIV